MTDIAKAIAFATNCLKWTDVFIDEEEGCLFVCDSGSDRSFDNRSASDLEGMLQEFLGKRYLIQINRGTSSLFHWCVIIGLQDRSVKGASFDNAQAEGENLWDVIFDACVATAHMDKAGFEPVTHDRPP
jgi:hypothetical protein